MRDHCPFRRSSDSAAARRRKDVRAFLRALEIPMTTTPPTSLQPLQLGMLIYPGMTLLDLAGPQAALGMHGTTHLVWKTMEPVPTDAGVALLPTTTFADCPRDLDVLFVPGGFGSNDVMEDADVLRFLAERGSRARYVTSVCSGSLVLGAAGLLDGYQAATHWAAYEALEALGVQGVHARVVIDRNRVTGGGVTAGIDFGLTLLAELRGEIAAKVTQLAMEYDPAPPFDTGSPASAGPALTAIATDSMKAMLARGLVIAHASQRSRSQANSVASRA
jgi:cyclohexyl-isocyanide hydratase